MIGLNSQVHHSAKRTCHTLCVLAKRVRLTGAYKGYIEIFEGSTWRKVNEENWDRNRQKFLCQHLGFGEIEMTITGRTRDIDDIATGDLVCYNKQPSGTSCCAYLQPSKTSSSITVPFANCKCERRFEGGK